VEDLPGRLSLSVEVTERLQRDLRHVVLDALGILLGGFRRHADRSQQIHHQAVTGLHAGREGFAFRGKENATIRA
jgi:hypothetical protein